MVQNTWVRCRISSGRATEFWNTTKAPSIQVTGKVIKGTVEVFSLKVMGRDMKGTGSTILLVGKENINILMDLGTSYYSTSITISYSI